MAKKQQPQEVETPELEKLGEVIDKTMAIVDVPENNDGIEMVGKVSKVFLEVLIALPDDEDFQKRLEENLQKQLNTKQASNRVRVTWHMPGIDNGKKNRKDYLLSKNHSRFYIYLDLYKSKRLPSTTFIAEALDKLKKLDQMFESLKMSGIVRSTNTYQGDKLSIKDKEFVEK